MRTAIFLGFMMVANAIDKQSLIDQYIYLGVLGLIFMIADIIVYFTKYNDHFKSIDDV